MNFAKFLRPPFFTEHLWKTAFGVIQTCVGVSFDKVQALKSDSHLPKFVVFASLKALKMLFISS